MRRHAAWILACTLVPLAGLSVAAPAGAQEPGPAGGDVAPTTSRDALLARARAFEEADRSFNLLRLELMRARERVQLAGEAVAAFRRGKTPADLADPALRASAELLALEAQAAGEAYEALSAGAGRARFVSLRDRLARDLRPLLTDLDAALGSAGDGARDAASAGLVDLRLARGELLAGKGRFDDARRDAEAAIRARPEDPRALGLLAMCLTTENRFDEAEALFRSACERAPTDERRAYHAIALYCLNRFTEARAARDAIQRPAELPAGLQVRSTWWLTDGELDRAEASWAREATLRAAEAARDDLPRVELVTSRGTITLELFEDHAPNAVAGLIELVEAGFYDGLPWSRVVPNLLVQTGDPAARPGAPGPDNAAHDAGWRLVDDPAPRDPARARGHFRGTASLVREDAPDSAGSQVFLTLMPSPSFDAQHVPIGRVVAGQAVADRLREGDLIEAARVVRKRDHAYVARKRT